MIIPITLPHLRSNCSLPRKLPPQIAKLGNDEVVLIELQGSLEVESQTVEERNGKSIGKLKVDDASNKATLLIGYHLLEGKVATLPKPLAVLLRSSESPPTAVPDKINSEAKEISWDMVAIVRRKIVFSKRPMPIAGSSSAGKETSQSARRVH